MRLLHLCRICLFCWCLQTFTKQLVVKTCNLWQETSSQWSVEYILTVVKCAITHILQHQWLLNFESTASDMLLWCLLWHKIFILLYSSFCAYYIFSFISFATAILLWGLSKTLISLVVYSKRCVWSVPWLSPHNIPTTHTSGIDTLFK